MSKNSEKTNVCRLLDGKKVSYVEHRYSPDEAVSATEVAASLQQDPQRVFKTLVTVAAAVGEKSVEMLKSKDLLGLTGYIHGGCSPIGMKKYFRTVIHETAAGFPTIIMSAGKIGYQVELSLDGLEKMIRFELCDLIK